MGLKKKKKKKKKKYIFKDRVFLTVFSLLYEGKGVQLIDVDKKLHQQTASSPGGGDSIIKVTGMFFVSLRVANRRFWSHMDAWDRKLLHICPFSMVSLRGQFKAQPHPHWCPLRVHF